MAALSLETLVEPGRAAFVAIEVQNGVVGRESALPALAEAAAEVGLIGNVARLSRAARAAWVPVIHCTAQNLPHGFGVNRNARLFAGARKAGADNSPGSSSVAPVPEVEVDPGDLILPRYHGLAPLTGGPLDSLLRNSGITTIVLAGVSLNIAVTNTVFDAVNRSYQVVLVTDAVAGTPTAYGREVITHTLSLLATLATTDQLVETWEAGAKL
jgi:nicotinamidase-related amidase